MSQRILVVLSGALLMVLTACGGGGGVTLSGGSLPTGGGTQVPSAGNWLLTAASQVEDSNGNIDYVHLRGAIAAAGNTVTATLRPDSGCLLSFNVSPLGDPVGFSGSVTDGSITLRSATASGSAATITGSVINGTTITGSYSSQGGASSHYASNGLCNGNFGTLSASYIAPINSTWTGSLANYNQGFLTCAGGNNCSGANFSSGKVYSNYLPDGDTAFADGSFDLQLGTGQPVTIIASSSANSDTLNELVPLINALRMGIKTAVAIDLTGSRLSLVDASGAGNVVTISNNTTGLVFPDLITVTTSIAQGGTANPDGSFPLSGTVTVQGQSLPCYSSSGAIDGAQSFIEGDTLHITTVMTNGVTFSLTPALLLNPNTSLKMSIPAATSTSADCAGDIATGTLCQLDSNGNCLTQVATGSAINDSMMRRTSTESRSQQSPGLRP